jgi:hypothetical protein
MRRGIVALVFRCEITGQNGEPPPGEVDEIAWLGPDQLSRMSEAYRVVETARSACTLPA